MNDIERIVRAEKLEKRFEFLKIYYTQEKQKVLLMREECKHEIVVYTEYIHGITTYSGKVYRKCLFCGKEGDSPHDFMDSQQINISKIDISLDRKQKFELVRKLYVEEAMPKPTLPMIEIMKLVQEKIDSGDEEFWNLVKKFSK